MAETDDGWAAYEVADVEPRQNGKNDTLAARQLWGLFVAAEPLQIHTAHEFPTANESFLRLSSLIESSDDLRAKVARIRYANGEQGIELLNGCRLKYRARTGGSGRGFAGASTVYLDEALFLEPKHLGALGPTLATSKSKGLDPQIWYASSPGLSTSAALWRLRRRALSGNGGRLAYVEHTGEIVSLNSKGKVVSIVPDVWDRSAWERANAALGLRIFEDFLENQANVDPVEFLREHVGVWDPEPDTDREFDRPITPELWADRLDRDGMPECPVVLGVSVGLAGRSASITAIGKRPDGRVFVECQDCRPGTSWLAERLELMLGSTVTKVAAVGIQSRGPAVEVLPDVIDIARRNRTTVVRLAAEEYAAACQGFVTAVLADQVRHSGQAWLTAAVSAASKRTRGDLWTWELEASADATPLAAASIAHRILETVPPRSKSRAYSF